MRLGFQRFATVDIQAIDQTIVNALAYTPEDPTALTLTITRPDGTEFASVTYPGTVTRLRVGGYSYTYLPDAEGTWIETWTGTLPAAGSAVVRYRVDP